MHEMRDIKNEKVILIRCNSSVIPEEFMSNNEVLLLNDDKNRQNCYNKDRMNKLLECVKTPTINYFTALYSLVVGKPIMVKTIRHQGGDGCHLITNVQELRVLQKEHEYLHFEKFIPFKHEYRVLCMLDQLILLEKYLYTSIGHQDSLAKCSHNGYKYKVKGIANENNVNNFNDVLQVLGIFKVQFCTIDIGVHNGKWYILEINSSLPLPKFTEKTQDEIAIYFYKSLKRLL